MATISVTGAITVSESLCRREAVTNAIADLRLEGLAPTARVQALLNEFVAGELTEQQLIAAVLAQ